MVLARIHRQREAVWRHHRRQHDQIYSRWSGNYHRHRRRCCNLPVNSGYQQPNDLGNRSNGRQKSHSEIPRHATIAHRPAYRAGIISDFLSPQGTILGI